MLDCDNNLLSVEELTVDFRDGKSGSHRALNGVSLSIADGEVVGLVGESGSGKTVLSHSLLGLLPPSGRVTSGRILWRGRELQKLPEKQLRPMRGKEIAMIFQDPQVSLNPVYPVGRQIERVLGRRRNLKGDELKSEILDLFSAVKLRDPERCFHAYPHELSGGMCQRIMISLALASQPKLLIADEPTSALDVSVAAGIVELLSQLQKEHGLSILLITHDLSVATRISNRIAVIDSGSIVETHPAMDFLKKAAHPSTLNLIEANRYLSQNLVA
ncbi:MAG: ABC transporter ATP-binding protein [Verrucomicrobiota bacterium]